MNLGYRARDKSKPHLRLQEFWGGAQPVRPSALNRDISLIPYYYQSDLPTCGAHAYAGFQTFVRSLNGEQIVQVSPMQFWKSLKLVDGIPPEDGTSMDWIFSCGQSAGIAPWADMPDAYPTTLQAYTDPSTLTSQILSDAQERVIKSDAYLQTVDYGSIANAIYSQGAVILALQLNTEGGNWWGNPTPTYDPAQPSSGHFLYGYDYDDPTQTILVVDSADQGTPHKKLNVSYPIEDVGTVVELPLGVLKLLLTERGLYQELLALYQELKEKLL